jgi:hypothetical protein
MSCFEVLDVLFLGLKASPVAGPPLCRPRDKQTALLIKKNYKFCKAVNFFQLLVVKTQQIMFSNTDGITY